MARYLGNETTAMIEASTMTTGIEDLLDSVMQGNTIRHPRYGGRGGEWDYLRMLPRSTLRTLTGAKMLTRHGLEPDVAATHYIGLDTCSAMAWYVGTCLFVIGERRRTARRLRHQVLAQRHGYRTYFRYREFQSILAGYSSYHYERQARWPS